MSEQENQPTEDQLKALDEIAEIGQEIQPDDYVAASSSSDTKQPVVEEKVAKTAKKSTSKKKTKKKEAAAPAAASPKKAPKKTKELLGGLFTKHEAPDSKWVTGQSRIDSTTHLGIAEFFYLFTQIHSDDQKIILLRHAKSDPVIMTLLNMNYNPHMYKVFSPNASMVKSYRKSTLPWGINPYTLRSQYRRLKYLFTNSPEGKKLPDDAKERIYAEFMEGLHPAEAKIFHQCASQSLNVEGFSAELVGEAFGKTRFPGI